MADKVKPDHVPRDQVLRDLMSTVRRSEGGWNPDGYTGPIKGVMKDGVRVITITTSASRSQNDTGASVEKLYNLRNRGDVMDAIDRALREIELVANVRFNWNERYDTKDKADIRFFLADVKPQSNANGLAYNGQAIRDIVINYKAKDFAPGQYDYGTILHEVLHAMGISHPGADPNSKDGKSGGDNRLYTRNSTVMSYNDGDLPHMRGLAPYDVLVLQEMYGKSKKSRKTQDVTAKELSESSVLYSEKALPIHLGDAESGDVSIDLSTPEFHKQITGNLRTGGKTKALGTRLALNTRVNDVTAGKNVKLNVTGSNLPNRLTGGDKDDTLTAHNGDDVLTGGKGCDKFRFTANSGMNNVITDYNAGEYDYVSICDSDQVSKIKLCFRDDFTFEGKVRAGTEATFFDNEGKAARSVFLLDTRPEAIELINEETVRVFDPKKVDIVEYGPIAERRKAEEERQRQLAAARLREEEAERERQRAAQEQARKEAEARARAEREAAQQREEKAALTRKAEAEKLAKQEAAKREAERVRLAEEKAQAKAKQEAAEREAETARKAKEAQELAKKAQSKPTPPVAAAAKGATPKSSPSLQKTADWASENTGTLLTIGISALAAATTWLVGGSSLLIGLLLAVAVAAGVKSYNASNEQPLVSGGSNAPRKETALPRQQGDLLGAVQQYAQSAQIPAAPAHPSGLNVSALPQAAHSIKL